MSGTVRYKDGAWRIAYQADSRRHYRTIHAPNNRKGEQTAGRALAQLITEVDRGRHRGDPNTTLNELVDEWRQHRAPSLEATTRAAYNDDLKRALPTLGNTKLQKLRPHDLDRLYRQLRDQGLAPKTIRNVHGTLSAILAHAVRWEWIDTNPATKASPPTAKRPAITVPTPEQINAIIQAARPDFAAMIRVAATTGHRRGTLLGLRWNHTDLDQGQVTFAAAVTAAEGQLHHKGTKADRADLVTLGPTVTDALRQHRTRALETALAAGTRLRNDAYVWAQDPGGHTPWHPGGVGHRWRTAARRADVTDVRYHDLKHFAVTRMLTAGIPPHVVAQRVGTSLPTILRVYAHYLPGADAEAASMMDALLG